MHSAVTEFKPQTFALAYPQPMPHMMGMGQERPLPVGADTALRVLQGCPQPDMGPEGGQGTGFLLTTPHSTGKRVSWGLDTDLLPPVPDRCWDPQLPLDGQYQHPGCKPHSPQPEREPQASPHSAGTVSPTIK